MSQTSNLPKKRAFKPRKNQPLVSALLLNRDISRSALLQQEDLDICIASMEMLMFNSINLLTQVSNYPKRHILDLWHRVVSGSIGNRLLYRGKSLMIPEICDIPEDGEIAKLKEKPLDYRADDNDDADGDEDAEDAEEDSVATKSMPSDVWKKLAEDHFLSYGAILLKASLQEQTSVEFLRLIRSLGLSREMYTQIVLDTVAIACNDDGYEDYIGLADRAMLLACKTSLTEKETEESVYIADAMCYIEQELEADPVGLYGALKASKAYLAQHQKLADAISTSYLRLVVKNAQQRKQAGESHSPDDDRQNGVFGLIRSIRMYDHRTGARFATYAGYWIRQAIRFHAKLQINMIRQPKSLWDSYNKVERARRVLEKQSPDKRQVTYKDLASETGLSIKQIEKIYTRVQTAQVRSLDFSMEGNDASESFTLKEVTPEGELLQDTGEDVSSKVLQSLGQLLQRLPDEEARVVSLRYGLLDHLVGDDMSLTAITKERIRQLITANIHSTQNT